MDIFPTDSLNVWMRKKTVILSFTTLLINVCLNLDNNIEGLVQDCSNSIANALELLQSCTKPSI